MYKFSKFKAKRTLQKVKFEHKAKLNIHHENRSPCSIRIPFVRSWLFVRLLELRLLFLQKKQTKSKSFELLSIHFEMITNKCLFYLVVVVVVVAVAHTSVRAKSIVYNEQNWEKTTDNEQIMSRLLSQIFWNREKTISTSLLSLALPLLSTVNVSLFSLFFKPNHSCQWMKWVFAQFVCVVAIPLFLTCLANQKRKFVIYKCCWLIWDAMSQPSHWMKERIEEFWHRLDQIEILGNCNRIVSITRNGVYFINV